MFESGWQQHGHMKKDWPFETFGGSGYATLVLVDDAAVIDRLLLCGISIGPSKGVRAVLGVVGAGI
jgi:hypothetical protein